MSDDLSPLEPNELDELLSADLDGELDAAARDLGFGSEEAAARIRATPGADDRRAALAAARDLLAEAPEIDELLAARLRAKAVRSLEAEQAARAEARRHRRNRVFAVAAGVAASLTVVVAIAAGLNGHGTSSKSANSSGLGAALAPEKAAATAGGARDTAALGKFTDAHTLALEAVLQTRVDRAKRDALGTAASTPAPGLKEQLPNPASTTPGKAGDQSTTAFGSAVKNTGINPNGLTARNNATFKTLGDGCPTPSQVTAGDTLALRATATLSGKPVAVLVFTGNGENIVVIEGADCKLVNVQMMS